MKGKRQEQQDTICISDLSRNQLNYMHLLLGVFDGHGGETAAQYACNNLYEYVNEIIYSPLHRHFHDTKKLTNIVTNYYEEKFNQCFQRLHSEIIEQYEDGSVALIILLELQFKRLIIANLGDVRAVIIKKNEEIIQLTVDHRPSNPEEKERIEKLGGYISGNRVNGSIAVTRSLGDRKISDYISHEPEVLIHQIQKEDDYLIIACDGLWDVLSNEEVIGIVHKYGRPDRAAAALRDFSYSKGSEDNISVIVYKFENNLDDDLNIRERLEEDDEKEQRNLLGDIFNTVKDKWFKKINFV